MAGGPSSSPLLHRTADSLTNSRVKEERESAMSRLLDANFNISTSHLCFPLVAGSRD